MPDWLVIITGMASAVATLLGIAALAARPLLRISRILRAVDGERGRPGLLDEFAKLTVTTGKLDRTLTDVIAEQRALAARLAAADDRLDRHLESQGTH